MDRPIRLIVRSFLVSLIFSTVTFGQTQDVTFRYIPDADAPVERAFVPGEFNGWGPNNNGVIATNAPSLMTYVDTLDQWIYTIGLNVGSTYEYKIHLHNNPSGTDGQWISDPLNPRINPAENNNSVVTIRDPMTFQAAHETNADGLLAGVSAGIFSSNPIATITFWVNGIERDGLAHYNIETGVFRFTLPRPVKAGSQFKVKVVDDLGQADSLEIGELLLPVSWAYAGFETVQNQASLTAFLTRQDGTIDSTVTSAILIKSDGSNETVPVSNGTFEMTTDLELGPNLFLLEAEIESNTFRSDSLVIVRGRKPLESFLFDVSAGGSGNAFSVNVSPTDVASGAVTFEWAFDAANSTTTVDGLAFGETNASGTAGGPGELYFDVVASDESGEQDRQRIGLIVEEVGTVRQMRYEETPAWVNQLVVYEIFPLSFGPQANGTEAAPGQRLREITAELDYIAAMGFNAIWFMPIMKNQFMDPLSGGYNIVDFYNIDPKLGTNDDFKALVARAHELGIKIIMDITPNHSSPIHPWVEALKQNGDMIPPGSFIQNEPSDHTRGLDNRGPNLSEVWQVSEGGNLYRKYDGFGDLANLDWDNDDLQSEFLNIIAHWIHEFDIDGWRFDSVLGAMAQVWSRTIRPTDSRAHEANQTGQLDPWRNRRYRIYHGSVLRR